MINDSFLLYNICKSWEGVHKLKYSHRLVTLIPGAGLIGTGSFINSDFWNLPFILSYSILDEVLIILKDQGVYQCNKRSPMLGKKMEASRNYIPWQDYDLVSDGRKARNKLAHEAILLPKRQCFIYIDAIEVELKAWRIL